ncbi:hypothetical protein AVEN_156609-1 [Araneus ventricosus]|uniref:Uncharacterized protein n=1 Tax=Araneus ventricosus TaxID=182803 RepID=A0A4Y1ZP32_ARAVE|nr:hypothetical protein AVEN_134626-1 [Araneus ventricosus]GBL61028.1 hypothetical protein AVEN_156609-1 [Araneus ventricosus]
MYSDLQANVIVTNNKHSLLPEESINCPARISSFFPASRYESIRRDRKISLKPVICHGKRKTMDISFARNFHSSGFSARRVQGRISIHRLAGTGFRCQKHVAVPFRAGPERYCNMFLRPKQAIKEAQRQALEIDGTVSGTT